MSDFRDLTGEEFNNTDGTSSRSFITSFADFMSRQFNDGEEIAFHAYRGEIVLVQSVTNHGKSTLCRNAGLALATGGEFAPIVSKGKPRKVLLLNLEGSGGRFQTDLAVMTRDFTSSEIELVRANFLPTHAPVIDDELLSLSRHMDVLEQDARKYSVDAIIIDTASAAFSIHNENDNSEVANSVMKRLLTLARKLNCVVVVVHHIGKSRSEEGNSREPAHKARGASAWGDFATSIFNIEASPEDRSRIQLTCAKRKDGDNYTAIMKLSQDKRSFTMTEEKPPIFTTSYEKTVQSITRETKTTEAIEIGKRLGIAERTTAQNLKVAVKDGRLKRVKHGVYAPLETAATASSIEKRRIAEVPNNVIDITSNVMRAA
ncbi:MAG TPA: AAA family ATPase [Pyrinomonadaceae bacterium]|jgi:RecA-family ATPase|nr:AAA family ATPase [Pyrinomonadaceae bacterium]